MTPALILYCSLACWRAELPPSLSSFLAPPHSEDLRRRRLESLRHARAVIQDTIAFYEKMADSGKVPPAIASECRRNAARLRKDIAWYKGEERRLWEEQPGGITAPAPRPKGTPLPPPPGVRD